MVDAARHDPEKRKLHVLIFSASLRHDSLNSKLARLAARHAERFGAVVDLASMRDFDAPSFDSDLEHGSGAPSGTLELNRRLTSNDAFVIACPEYNASMPGVIKNAIDWVSRIKPQPFHERHGLLISASPSMVGGNRGLWALRVPLEHLGARVFPDMFSLATAHQAFDGDSLKDSRLQQRFEQNLHAFLDLAEAAKNYPCLKKAWVEFLGESPDMPTDRVEAG